MPFLVAQIDAAPVDLRRWAAVLPLVITRLRELSFDSDGVVRFPSGRREGLRLVDGRAGRTGATYGVVLPETVVDPVSRQERSRPAVPIELTVERDTTRELRVALSSTEYDAEITLESPTAPTRAHGRLTMVPPDVPSWLGRKIKLEGTLDVTDVHRPMLEVEGRMRRARASARLQHLDGKLRLDLTVRPKGLLRFAALLWPFVSGQARRSVVEQMTEAWPGVVAALATDRTVESAADEIMLGLENDLVERVAA
ncbi:MAG TPA: hypothetical protein VEX66_09545 [Microlunatus sp.]|nr:hypothetical protein [Microlunatus sp.]